jgi:2-polyprenyl-3-methyl-5-hydroxy-6-metoxy-1,4-benzoquinol methylase
MVRILEIQAMTDLIAQYRAIAAGGASLRGLSILQHAKQIGALVKQHEAKRLLDYGCGAGDAYRSPHKLHKQWGLQWFDVTLYDPAFERLDEKPYGKFDGVICSDVLEHVPEADVDAFIANLFTHAKKFVWASVCCRPAKKCFADGTNLHCTVQPFAWWQAKFEEQCEGLPFVLVETP